MEGVIVAGIDTEIGKTVISAILCEAWGADYWKPIQSGIEEQTDTQRVQELVPLLEVPEVPTEESWADSGPAVLIHFSKT